MGAAGVGLTLLGRYLVDGRSRCQARGWVTPVPKCPRDAAFEALRAWLGSGNISRPRSVRINITSPSRSPAASLPPSPLPLFALASRFSSPPLRATALFCPRGISPPVVPVPDRPGPALWCFGCAHGAPKSQAEKDVVPRENGRRPGRVGRPDALGSRHREHSGRR